jgi:hypothetical protein
MADASNSLDSGASSPSNAEFFSPAYLERRLQSLESVAEAAGFRGIDEGDPIGPSGHAYAIRTSTRLTSFTKRHQRKASMDITPQEVIDVLISAGVKNWVLMGLQGYVGYMPSPRATQDVDIMVSYSERNRAKKGNCSTLARARPKGDFPSDTVSGSNGT